MNAWCIRLAYLVRTDPVSEMSGQAIAKTIEPKNLDIIFMFTCDSKKKTTHFAWEMGH